MSPKLLTYFSETLFDRVGHFNPQLLREWQGRLRWRNVILTGLFSLLVQGAVVFQRLTQLPTGKYSNSRYCLRLVDSNQYCELGPGKMPLIDWTFVWADVFRDLSFVLVWTLIVAGVYLLAADLSKESRRGTINFLRMSPLSRREILVGKLLGVPILLYLGIGLLLPLHLLTGLGSTYPLTAILGFYSLLGALTFCFYAAGLWFALLGTGLQGLQTWLISGLSFGLLTLGLNITHTRSSADWFHLFNPLQVLTAWLVKGTDGRTLFPFDQGPGNGLFRSLSWLYLPVGDRVSWFLLFALANALVLGLWFWTVLERKFQMPTNTLLSKRQSYGLTLYLSVIILGFEMQYIPEKTQLQPTGYISEYFWGYPISMMIWSLLLMFLLLPSKQSLLDWTRYRHQTSRSVADLFHHDGSPSAFAFVTNMAIIGGVLLLGVGAQGLIVGTMHPPSIFWTWLCCAAALIICSLVVQWISLSNFLHWRWLAIGAVAAVIAGWPILLAMGEIDTYSESHRFLWLTTAFPQAAINEVQILEMCLAIAVQLTIIAGLSWCLNRRCQVLGQSEWKALLETGKTRLQQETLL
ncbi:MAG: ABC transporter permease subunit [Phormidesmis sp.]